MSTFAQLISRIRPTLNDLSAVRYSDPNLLEWAVDGLREMVVYRPDLFTVTGTFTCVAGHEQALSGNALYIVDILANGNGDVIPEADLMTLSAFNQSWRNDAPDVASVWMRVPVDGGKDINDHFYLYPPSPEGQQLKAAWVELNTALSLGSSVPIPNNYEPALEAYMIFRAESIDDEHVVEQRAALFRQAFEMMLGVGKKTEEPGA